MAGLARDAAWWRPRIDIALFVLAIVLGGWVASDLKGDEGPAPIVPKVLDDGRFRPGTLGSPDDESAVAFVVSNLPEALSYDYRSLDKAADAAAATMTNDFARTFRATFDATRQTAATRRAVMSTLVRAAGIGDVDGDRRTVLAYIDQVLVAGAGSAQQEAPAITRSRVVVELVPRGEEWAIDDIRPQ
ncbi:hypothetical protein [Nocardioides sp. LML1-1-1.1]|uniref:hypothetical protein n=1 Tax=Nocardioides sp. LML1-1-1.1 TaxID=3135248 RepID=UPI003429C5D0